MATAAGDTNSAVATATYTMTPTVVATPTFSPVAGTYPAAQTVSISDATSGATIYYTTNGTTPTTSSTEYTGPITVGSTETLQAIAVATGDTTSAVASATYTITPVAQRLHLHPAAGTYTSTQTVSSSVTPLSDHLRHHQRHDPDHQLDRVRRSHHRRPPRPCRRSP